MGFTKTKFKTIKLTEGDALFVNHVLHMYAQQTTGLDSEDKAEIKKVAAKFK
jgi:hypothetical protein